MPGLMRLVDCRMLVVLIIFTLVMGTACSVSQAPGALPGAVEVEQTRAVGEETEPAGKPDTIDPGEPGAAEDEIEVRFQGEGFKPPRYPSLPFGNISFTADNAAVVEREIKPGEPLEKIQVVDDTGLTWSLEIPAGALDGPQTVKMVPLSNLDSSGITEAVGELVSGVRLEPDGLTFLKPLRLSISSATLQGPTFILSGTQAGADIGYTLQDTSADQPTARILHFSTYFASQPQEEALAAAQNQAWKEYQRLAAQAKKLLKEPLDMPTPPSIPLECPDAETGQENHEAINEFIENAQNPETDLIALLLKQRTIMALTGDAEMDGVSASDVEPALARRVGRKAMTMMKQYYGQEEKLVAVSEFAIKTARQLALLNADQQVIAEILNNLASWNSKLIDTLIDDIRKNHNYKRIPVVWMIAANAELLGAGSNTESFIEKLKNALHFEVQIQLDVNMPDINNITDVTVPVQFDPDSTGLYQCSGEGQAKYLQVRIDDPDSTVETSQYMVQVVVKDFDPCNGTVNIALDRFGSDNDTITITTEDGSEMHAWPISRDAGKSLYNDELKDGLFWFELPVQNGSATAVDETIERTRHEVVHGELSIKMIHK